MSRLTALQTQLDAERQTTLDQAARIDSLKRENEGLAQQVVALQQDRSVREDQLKLVNDSLALTVDEMDSAREEVGNLWRQITQLESVVAERENLSKQVADLNARLQAADVNYRRARETIAELEATSEEAITARNIIEEEIPGEFDKYLRSFITGPEFVEAALASRQHQLRGYFYDALSTIGRIEGFAPEKYGVRKYDKDGALVNLDLSQARWIPDGEPGGNLFPP